MRARTNDSGPSDRQASGLGVSAGSVGCGARRIHGFVGCDRAVRSGWRAARSRRARRPPLGHVVGGCGFHGLVGGREVLAGRRLGLDGRRLGRVGGRLRLRTGSSAAVGPRPVGVSGSAGRRLGHVVRRLRRPRARRRPSRSGSTVGVSGSSAAADVGRRRLGLDRCGGRLGLGRGVGVGVGSCGRRLGGGGGGAGGGGICLAGFFAPGRDASGAAAWAPGPWGRPRPRTARRPGAAAAPRRLTVASSSSLTCVGLSVGCTWLRIGENAAASSTATHRSGRASWLSDAVAAPASEPASSAGKRTPAFGGCDDSFRARTTRPTPRAASMSPSHSASSLSCLVTRPP